MVSRSCMFAISYVLFSLFYDFYWNNVGHTVYKQSMQPWKMNSFWMSCFFHLPTVNWATPKMKNIPKMHAEGRRTKQMFTLKWSRSPAADTLYVKILHSGVLPAAFFWRPQTQFWGSSVSGIMSRYKIHRHRHKVSSGRCFGWIYLSGKWKDKSQKKCSLLYEREMLTTHVVLHDDWSIWTKMFKSKFNNPGHKKIHKTLKPVVKTMKLDVTVWEITFR